MHKKQTCFQHLSEIFITDKPTVVYYLAFCFSLLTTHNRKPMAISVYSISKSHSDIMDEFVLYTRIMVTCQPYQQK